MSRRRSLPAARQTRCRYPYLYYTRWWEQIFRSAVCCSHRGKRRHDALLKCLGHRPISTNTMPGAVFSIFIDEDRTLDGRAPLENTRARPHAAVGSPRSHRVRSSDTSARVVWRESKMPAGLTSLASEIEVLRYSGEPNFVGLRPL